MNIGIDSQQDLVYEGPLQNGRAVWPSPIITQAKITLASDGPLIAERSNDSVTSACRFREDSYDPIARIRRGRFYFARGRQPIEWTVQRHPALVDESLDPVHLRKTLDTFYGDSIWHKYLQGRSEQPLVLLGVDDRFAVWTIISVEAISTGEDLVTLKSRSGFGILPIIYDNKIPRRFRAATREALNAFADEVHRSAPISVIDRARDAASQMLLAYFNTTSIDARDLGELTKRLEDKKKIVAASAARIISRLHARAKPVERAKRRTRSIREQDAELATQCVGTILCELGWADWQ